MSQEEILKRLKEPFTSREIEWKVQVTTQDKTKGMVVAYIDSRAIQNRLDEVVGAFNWRNTFSPWQNNSQICGLSIYDSERGEWLTKWDGAENTDIEPVKGGLSDSFKRAACVWGICRYLYELTGIWVEIEQRGKSSVIKENQYAKLDAEYNKAIAKIFGASSTQGKNPASLADNKTTPKQSETNNQASVASATGSDYWVQAVKPSGKESQRLELVTWIPTTHNYICEASVASGKESNLKTVLFAQYYVVVCLHIARPVPFGLCGE